MVFELPSLDHVDVTDVEEAAEASVEGARLLPMNHYKVDLTKAIITRALMSIIENRKRRLL